MIIWLNGTFGAGKTTTAQELAARIPDSRIFDAEKVGEMLWHVLGTDRDFQEFRPWRGLVVESIRQVLDYTGGSLIITQTVLNKQYWGEIHAGLTDIGIPVSHFALHTDRDTLVGRIESDVKPGSINARGWRLGHLADYERAIPWLHAQAEVIDTTVLPPAGVAEFIMNQVRIRS